MRSKIDQLLAEIDSLTAVSREELEALRVRLMGKKGSITALFDDFKQVAAEEKREIGQLLNVLKTKATERINELRAAFEATTETAVSTDLSMPGAPAPSGARPSAVDRAQ